MPQSDTTQWTQNAEGWACRFCAVTKNRKWTAALDIYFNHLADNVTAFRAKKKKDDQGSEKIPGIPGIRIIDWEDEEKVEKILSEAVDKAFEGLDLDKMEKDFFAWVNSL